MKSKASHRRTGIPRRPTVAMVILNWNNPEDTLGCLHSVAALDYRSKRTIVVDNGSTDESVLRIRSTYPNLEIIETGKNLGYAEGNNLGVGYALGSNIDYILLLNNDTHLAPDSLSHLVSAAERHHRAAFLGPKILHRDRPNQLQSAGGQLDWIWRSHQRGLDEEDRGQYHTVEDVDYVIGAAVLVRVSTLPKIGLLDPDFFLYREDVDWCLRARHLGYRILYVPEAKVWHRSHHVRDDELPRTTYYMTRNSLLLFRKHRASPLRAAGYLALRAVHCLNWTVNPKWRSKRTERDALLRGVRDFFLGRVGRGYD